MFHNHGTTPYPLHRRGIRNVLLLWRGIRKFPSCGGVPDRAGWFYV
jgi:hypothetical protein